MQDLIKSILAAEANLYQRKIIVALFLNIYSLSK